MKRNSIIKFVNIFTFSFLSVAAFNAYALKLPKGGDSLHSGARSALENIEKRLGTDLNVQGLNQNQLGVISGFAQKIKDPQELQDRIAEYLKTVKAVKDANTALATWKPLTTSSAIAATKVTEPSSKTRIPVTGVKLTEPGHEAEGTKEAPAGSVSPEVALNAGMRAANEKYIVDADSRTSGIQIGFQNADGSKASVTVSEAAAKKAAELTGSGIMAKVAEEMGANLIPDGDPVHVGGGRLTALVAEQLEAQLAAKKDIKDPANTKIAYKKAIEAYVLGKDANGKTKSLDQAAKDAAGPKRDGESDADYAARIAAEKAKLEESIKELCDCSGQC